MEKVTYKAVQASVRSLSEVYQSQSYEDSLFCSEALLLRHKLKISLLKIIFLNPVDYGVKAEDLLWRKVFYEVIVLTKKRKKTARLSVHLEYACKAHILAAVGFYQQLMLKILDDYKVTESLDFIDFAVAEGTVAEKPVGITLLQHSDKSGHLAKWASTAIYSCLMHLGDLYRYLLDFKPGVYQALVQRYYNLAAQFSPIQGLPFNQLGTLDMGNMYNMTAIYYYLRCLACDKPFIGTKKNLQSVFDKNHKRYLDFEQKSEIETDSISPTKVVKRFIVSFLYLIDMFHRPYKFSKTVDLSVLCESVLKMCQQCCNDVSNTPSVLFSEVDPLHPDKLSDTATFELFFISVMTLEFLHISSSRHTHVCTAFCLAIFSHVVHLCLTRSQLVLGSTADDTEEALSQQAKPSDKECEIAESKPLSQSPDDTEEVEYVTSLRRRRRRRSSNQSDDSDAKSSSCDLAFSDNNADSDGDDDLMSNPAAAAGDGGVTSDRGAFCFSYGIPSALQDQLDNSSNAHNPDADAAELPTADNPDFVNFMETSHDPKAQSSEVLVDKTDQDIEKMLVLLSNVRLFSTVKIGLDWMLCNPHTLSKPVQLSCLSLWDRLALLLNYIPPKTDEEDCGVISPESGQVIPLPEDLHVRSFSCLRQIHKNLDFSKLRVSRSEDTKLRFAILRRFGFLAVQNDNLSFEYDSLQGQFLGPSCIKEVQQSEMMRNMAQMRLKSEVERLETAVQDNVSLSTCYLILSRKCLTDHLDALAVLLKARKFIVVLPRSSIDHLDRQKRASTPARVASRFLEGEMHRGNPFLNAHEYPNLTICAAELRRKGPTTFLTAVDDQPPSSLDINDIPVKTIIDFLKENDIFR